MFKSLIEWGVMALIILTLVTQILLPLFIPELELFWIFKGAKPATKDPINVDLETTLDTLSTDALTKAKALENTMHTVDSSIDTLTKLKEKVQH